MYWHQRKSIWKNYYFSLFLQRLVFFLYKNLYFIWSDIYSHSHVFTEYLDRYFHIEFWNSCFFSKGDYSLVIFQLNFVNVHWYLSFPALSLLSGGKSFWVAFTLCESVVLCTGMCSKANGRCLTITGIVVFWNYILLLVSFNSDLLTWMSVPRHKYIIMKQAEQIIKFKFWWLPITGSMYFSYIYL